MFCSSEIPRADRDLGLKKALELLFHPISFLLEKLRFSEVIEYAHGKSQCWYSNLLVKSTTWAGPGEGSLSSAGKQVGQKLGVGEL